MKWLLLLSSLLFRLVSHATVNIAFIEVHHANGALQQMEPGGRFSHIAISYKGFWLHAHPYRGVELLTTEQLKNLDEHSAIIVKTVPDKNELTEVELETYIGKPFDSTFSWESDSYYCSKLVAKILGLSPNPMNFSTALWPQAFKSKAGNLGISPDDIYKQLQHNVFRRQLNPNRCENLFLTD